MTQGHVVTVTVVMVSGGPVPAAGEHVETLQETLQATDQAWSQQGPAGRGKLFLILTLSPGG